MSTRGTYWVTLIAPKAGMTCKTDAKSYRDAVEAHVESHFPLLMHTSILTLTVKHGDKERIMVYNKGDIK